MIRSNPWLLAGGGLSVAAALLHLACIVGGPDWYRFLGAGEEMAQAAARGDWRPHALTLGIAAMLGLWGAYAFSGAGVLPRLPLMRTALVLISAVYLARGLLLFAPSMMRRPDLSPDIMMWSSLIVLLLGIVHAVGLWQAWPQLSSSAAAHHGGA